MLRRIRNRFKGKVINLIYSQKTFEFLQRRDIQILRKHFHTPLPDTAVIARQRHLWERESSMPGIDMHLDEQRNLLHSVFAHYLTECEFPKHPTTNPSEYYVYNRYFGLISAIALHGIIRHFQPRRMIEVGSGMSTMVSARALELNRAEGHPGELIAIEPYPREVLKKGFPGLSRLIVQKVEEVDPELFATLGDGDILFIDSSHVTRIGGDVNFLFLEILPRLQKGVIIHVHDIFFPLDYPKTWIVDNRWFWTEQYLLQAFLIYNRAFSVLWAENYMLRKARRDMEAVFSDRLGFSENYNSSSFWMRKTA